MVFRCARLQDLAITERHIARRGLVPVSRACRTPRTCATLWKRRDADMGSAGPIQTGSGRLAQRESASFTPRRSLVRSQYRPPSSAAGSDHGTGLVWSCDSSKRHASQSPSLRRASGASDGASEVCVLTARRTS
jgi:hypothetical protein